MAVFDVKQLLLCIFLLGLLVVGCNGNEESPAPTVTPTDVSLIPTPTSTDLPLEIISVDTIDTGKQFFVLRAMTAPDAYCTITLKYSGGSGQLIPTGLDGKYANSDGRVSWVWIVDSSMASGLVDIVVTASKAGQQVSVNTEFSLVDRLPQEIVELMQSRERIAHRMNQSLTKLSVDGHIPGRCEGCP
jgi:hypothetical protein